LLLKGKFKINLLTKRFPKETFVKVSQNNLAIKRKAQNQKKQSFFGPENKYVL